MGKNKKEESEIENKGVLKEFLDLWKDLAIIIIVVLFIRSFLVMPFQINGQSMYDSYYDREFIIVDRFSYLTVPYVKAWEPERWDVVVFKPHISKEKEYFIKRIVWLPWDKLKITDWKVYLYDEIKADYSEIDEWYLSDSNKWSTFVSWTKWESVYEVPAGSYFVMWDNRNGSTDSRTCFRSCLIEWKSNYIVKENIIGKIFLDLWYFNWINSVSISPFKIEFWSFSFVHPNLWIDTHPKWFSSPWSYDY